MMRFVGGNSDQPPTTQTTMEYSDYINAVGIEFEGFWRDPHSMPKKYFADSCVDESLRCDPDSVGDKSSHYTPLEFQTHPFKDPIDLEECIDYVDDLMEKKDYDLNSSVGLHYHISLTKPRYHGMVTEVPFYGLYANMLQEHFKDVYRTRAFHRFCRRKIDYPEGHFKLQSDEKYHLINYQYSRRGTIEFRAYGGEHATIKGLKSCIQKTLNLIKDYIDSPRSFEFKIEYGPDDMPKAKEELTLQSLDGYRSYSAEELEKLRVEAAHVIDTEPLRSARNRIAQETLCNIREELSRRQTEEISLRYHHHQEEAQRRFQAHIDGSYGTSIAPSSEWIMNVHAEPLSASTLNDLVNTTVNSSGDIETDV